MLESVEESLTAFPRGSGTGWRPASQRTCQINLPETRCCLWLPLSHPQQIYLSQLEAGLIPCQVEGQETTHLYHPLGAGRGLEAQVFLLNSGQVPWGETLPSPPCSGPADVVQRPGAFPVRGPAQPLVLGGRYAPGQHLPYLVARAT